MRNKIDLLESYDGDLIANHGDIGDTSFNPARTYYQILRLLLNTKPGENKIYSEFGIDFDQFIGRINTEALGNEMARLVKQKISENTLLFKQEVEVTPFPINEHTIALQIHISTLGGNYPDIVTVMNTRDGNIYSTDVEESNFNMRITVPKSPSRLT